MNQQKPSHSLSLKNICGPYDAQFRRKFLGNRSTSLSSHRNIILRSSVIQLKNQPLKSDLFPKIQELQKLSKSSSKKLGKLGKGKVISQLELYLAKKIATNQSTKQIVCKIEENALRGEKRWHHLDNQAKNIKYSQTESNFYSASEGGIKNDQPGTQFQRKTMYNSRKKVSDQQFKEKFDKILARKPSEGVVRLNDLLGNEKREQSDHLILKLQNDKDELKKIIKKMIEQIHEQSQLEYDQNQQNELQKKRVPSQKGVRGIRWILQKCEQLQKKGKIKSK